MPYFEWAEVRAEISASPDTITATCASAVLQPGDHRSEHKPPMLRDFNSAAPQQKNRDFLHEKLRGPRQALHEKAADALDTGGRA